MAIFTVGGFSGPMLPRMTGKDGRARMSSFDSHLSTACHKARIVSSHRTEEGNLRKYLVLLLAIALTSTTVDPAAANGNSENAVSHANVSDPALQVTAKRPHQVFEFNDGFVSVVSEGLDSQERQFALELADSLNNGARNGWLKITKDSSQIEFTKFGATEVERRIESVTNECVAISNVSVSWQGYAFDMETTCSDAELEALVAERDAEIRESYGAEPPVVRETQAHTNPMTTMFGSDFWCWVSVAGLVASFVGAIFLIAFPPTTGIGIAWVSVTISFGLSYIGTVFNCTGIRSVQVNSSGLASLGEGSQIRLPQGHRTQCYYSYSYGWKWDPALGRNVPTKIKWVC